MGDQLLQQVSARLLLCVREGDCVARFGGDEFVVLLDALSQNAADAAQQAQSVAQKILQMMQQPFDLQGHSVAASLSVGLVIFSRRPGSQAEMLRQADLAMYRAEHGARTVMRLRCRAASGSGGQHTARHCFAREGQPCKEDPF